MYIEVNLKGIKWQREKGGRVREEEKSKGDLLTSGGLALRFLTWQNSRP